MDYAIEVKDIWKKYRIYHDRSYTLKETLLFRNRNRYEDLWALKGVDLKVKPGQTIGLIGQNGSGKSTLLKLMSRIIYPDRGSIRINGKVSSLLELGAGFHPDFTGLENIYMNAAIFGMTRKEIERKLDDIIEFSELGDFITSPVRTYSSGMYMRLAFAVAVNVDPDILLIDEILSVGDESFQKKCFSYMQDIKQKGCTMVIVSHSLGEIKKICDQVVWLHDGIIKINGECDFVIDQYRNQMLASADPQIKSAPEQSHYFPPDPDPSRDIVTQDIGGRTGVGVTPSRWGTGQAEIYDVTIRNSLNEIKTSFNYGEEVIIQYSYQLKDSLQDVVFGLGIFLRDGTRCYGTNTELAQLFFPLMDKGRTGKVRISMSNLYLTDGEYVVNVAIHNKDGVSFDYHHRLYAFRIVSGSNEIGIVRPHIQWQVQ